MRFHTLSIYVVFLSALALIGLSERIFAEPDLDFQDEAKIDFYLGSIYKAHLAQERAPVAGAPSVATLAGGGPDETTSPDPYNSDPQNGPLDSGYSDPYGYGTDGSLITRKNGGAELIAMKVFLETLKFYGVTHYLNKVGARVDFKILKSKNGYFANLTKLDVAYAIREFGRYLSAYMCGNATMENFYIMFSQIAEVGLRFKYDMAWALLGNSLPKEPNAVYKLNTRWSAFNKIIRNSQILRNGSSGGSDDGSIPGGLKPAASSWVTDMADAVSIMTQLGGLVCMTDFRPVPRVEIKKRVVVKKFLTIQADLLKEYGGVKELMDAMEKQGAAEQIQSLRKT
jgi:hypothetical protein